MDPTASVLFFDTQFQRQVREPDLRLNPFEERALPFAGWEILRSEHHDAGASA